MGTCWPAAMMLRHSFGMKAEAARAENAVRSVLAAGIATPDLVLADAQVVGTNKMGDAIVAALTRSERA